MYKSGRDTIVPTPAFKGVKIVFSCFKDKSKVFVLKFGCHNLVNKCRDDTKFHISTLKVKVKVITIWFVKGYNCTHAARQNLAVNLIIYIFQII